MSAPASSTTCFTRHADALAGACLVILLKLAEGWVAFTPEGRYKLGGDVQGGFWHAVNLCRFEPGEFDPYLPEPLRLPDDWLFLPPCNAGPATR